VPGHITSYRIRPSGNAWAWHIFSGSSVIAAGESADMVSARVAAFLWVMRHAERQDHTRH
jgi:hypothetical protein